MAFLNFKRKNLAQPEDKRQVWGVEGAAPFDDGGNFRQGAGVGSFSNSGADYAYAAGSQAVSAASEVQRARYRLLGAATLVLVLGLLLVLVFDAKPRPMPLDTPIVMGSGAQPRVLGGSGGGLRAGSASAARVETGAITSTNTPASAAKEQASTALPAPHNNPALPAAPAEKPLQATPVKPVATNLEPTPAKAEVQVETPAEIKVSKTPPTAKPKPVDKAEKAEKADKADSDKEGGSDAATGRFIVQAGAFEDNASARALRLKLESQGVKTYAQVATVKGERLIRIRVGPYKTRSEAEQSAKKLKALGHEAGIYKL